MTDRGGQEGLPWCRTSDTPTRWHHTKEARGMMTTEQALLKARGQFDHLIELVQQATGRGERIDLVERDLMRNLLALGHSLLTTFIAQQGQGDSGPEITTAEGTTAA